ncbi:MAG TPA: peptide ABC transporter permease, partial [Gammaproteobacteria bacterium]|nr:peptide ABC transporter permease [Gammaproteobacteria bacterium]
ALLTVCTLCLVTGITTQLAGEYHLLGTDKVGQDVLYLGLKSIRTGILIGVLTLLVMLPLAIFMGVTAGYFGGRVDDLVQYLYTTLSSIPGVLLIAASVLTVNLYLDQNLVTTVTLQQRADLRLLMLTAILGLTGWIGLCRLLRGESLKLRELDYVTAAISMGVNNRLVLTRHLLPNLAHLVLITAVIDFSGLVLAEAVLSYVGVGVDPSMISWGNMINSARLEMAREPVVWWSLTTAFLFMFTLVLAANLFADAVRDAFDPRLRGSF